MTDVPPAPDVRPAWLVAVARSWGWFRDLPTWVQVVSWLVGWPLLPAWWLLARARGPGGVAAAAVLAIMGMGVAAAALQDGEPAASDRAGVNAATTEDDPGAIEPIPSSTPSPPPSSTPSAAPTSAPSAVTTPSPPGASPSDVPTSEPSELPGQVTTVERIVDGDTLYLAGLPERARLIGIDTPETVAPGTPVECFGPEATAELTRLVPPGTEVRVVYDVERTDRYDRPLVYLHRVSDNLFVNRAMLARGFAQMATYPPNVKHVDEFRRAQRDARDASRGLWAADCGDTDQGSSSGASGSGAAGGGTTGGGDAIVIADLVWDGPGDDVQFGTSEHVVLRNDSGSPVDVGGWSLTDLADHRITIPAGTTIPADEVLLVHTGPGDNAQGAHHDGGTQAIWNNSGGDTATLRNAAGVVVDEYSYSS